MKIHFPVVLLLLLFAAVVPATTAGAADTSCLTGTDPSVAADAGQIAALELSIADACPCDDFDGSDGNKQRDYKKCYVTQIKAAFGAGMLRAKCKGTVLKAYKASTCGYPTSLEKVPCIETMSSGKRRCVVSDASECVSEAERVDRLPCPSATRCVDAADTSGDYRVDADDSGDCVVPPTTSTTLEPTTTTTLEPTTTTTTTSTTLEPTTTTTSTLDTTTSTTIPEEVWILCAQEGQPCTLPGNRIVRYGAPGGPYKTRSLHTTPHRSSFPCNSETFGELPAAAGKRCEYTEEESCEPDFDSGPYGMPTLDEATDFQEVIRVRGNESIGDHFICDVNSGCFLEQTVVALDPHTFSLMDPVDSRVCNGAPSLSYHWQIFYPLGLTNPDVYASQGITGYFSRTLSPFPNAMPNQDESTNPDQYWRMKLTVTEAPRADIPVSAPKSRVYIFRFLYEGSAYGLTMSATCQTKFMTDSECMVQGLLRATEPF